MYFRCLLSQSRYFYPRSPRGERRRPGKKPLALWCNFYPRSPRGERRRFSSKGAGSTCISIHAPREGSDTRSICKLCRKINFYPRSPRGERHAQVDQALRGGYISIHAPREGSDAKAPYPNDQPHISIHAPREGSDHRFVGFITSDTSFLSTLPARGATMVICPLAGRIINFYPRSPRGERRFGEV